MHAFIISAESDLGRGVGHPMLHQNWNYASADLGLELASCIAGVATRWGMRQGMLGVTLGAPMVGWCFCGAVTFGMNLGFETHAEMELIGIGVRLISLVLAISCLVTLGLFWHPLGLRPRLAHLFGHLTNLMRIMPGRHSVLARF